MLRPLHKREKDCSGAFLSPSLLRRGEIFPSHADGTYKIHTCSFFNFPSAKRGKWGEKREGIISLRYFSSLYVSTVFPRGVRYMSWAFGSWDANALRRRRPGSERGCGSPRGPRVRGRGYPVSIPGIPISYRERIQLSYGKHAPTSHASPLFVSLFFLLFLPLFRSI